MVTLCSFHKLLFWWMLLPLLWPDPKAREFHCSGIIACVSLLKGRYVGVLDKLPPLLQTRRYLVLGFILPGNDKLVLVSMGLFVLHT